MSVTVALVTADLRVHDSPVLCGALDAADLMVPLFVLDDGVRAAGVVTPNRAAFLAESLADLDKALRERGGRLVLRTGDVVWKVCCVADETAAGEVHIAGDASGLARRRAERLSAAVHRPWRLPTAPRRRLDSPDPIVDLHEGAARLCRARSAR
jgi:deoxyribodipyrimidine photo-lyase